MPGRHLRRPGAWCPSTRCGWACAWWRSSRRWGRPAPSPGIITAIRLVERHSAPTLNRVVGGAVAGRLFQQCGRWWTRRGGRTRYWACCCGLLCPARWCWPWGRPHAPSLATVAWPSRWAPSRPPQQRSWRCASPRLASPWLRRGAGVAVFLRPGARVARARRGAGPGLWYARQLPHVVSANGDPRAKDLTGAEMEHLLAAETIARIGAGEAPDAPWCRSYVAGR